MRSTGNQTSPGLYIGQILDSKLARVIKLLIFLASPTGDAGQTPRSAVSLGFLIASSGGFVPVECTLRNLSARQPLKSVACQSATVDEGYPLSVLAEAINKPRPLAGLAR